MLKPSALAYSFCFHALLGLTLWALLLKDMRLTSGGNPPRAETLSFSVEQEERAKLAPTSAKSEASRVESVGVPASASEKSLAAPGPSSAASGSASAESAYLSKLRARIEAAKRYPIASISRREQGTLQVTLILNKDGTFDGIRLLQASPYPALNRAALEAVQAANKTEPIPDDLKKDRWEIVVPVSFELKRR